MCNFDIFFRKTEGDRYLIEIDAAEGHQAMKMYSLLTRDELKELRNSIHNILLDLNMELNYEQ